MLKPLLNRRRKPPKHNLTGQLFGYLAVTAMAQAAKTAGQNSQGGIYYALCDCSNCGKKDYPVLPTALLKGWTTSCGCRRDQYQKIVGSKNKTFTGYEDIRGSWWAHVKRCARDRNLIFEITKEQVWALYLAQNRLCKLSKLPIVFGGDLSKTTASLDRIDSALPYVLSNIQLVHKDVNIMKNSLIQSRFITLCKRIAENHGNV